LPSKLEDVLEMMHLFTLLTKNLYIIYKFDHVEAWKISY